ncbi:protein of unknown function [Bradyrhizobium vignae]|uniref:Uncharacterized protein n=1 Tax=Bradyrhizobium vignae TaxID=1549949 RepID=A0A2U3Q0L1_9BRAD|nr:protein of unknown function [Bradyrhizobium vignae]
MVASIFDCATTNVDAPKQVAKPHVSERGANTMAPRLRIQQPEARWRLIQSHRVLPYPARAE